MQEDHSVATLVAEIKACTSKLEKNEEKSLLSVIQLAGLYLELRQKVKSRQWQSTLADLGISPRVVSRYLKIGQRWCTGTPLSSELLTKLPYDVHKLEWLAKLSPEKLARCVGAIDCKQSTRGAIIKLVKELLGESQAAPQATRVTVQDLKKRWSGYVDRMVTAVGNVDLHTVDDQSRVQLLAELHAKFSELAEALNTEAEGSESPEVAVMAASLTEHESSGEFVGSHPAN
jgi:hypothetical protein